MQLKAHLRHPNFQPRGASPPPMIREVELIHPSYYELVQIHASLLTSLTACTIYRKQIVRLATTVDPCTKALHLIDVAESEAMWRDLLAEMRQQQPSQPSVVPLHSAIVGSNSAAAAAVAEDVDGLDWNSATVPASHASAAVSSSDSKESVEEELRRWRLEVGLQFTDSANALQWWTRSDDQRRLPNWQRFPTISKIARRVLCIPATSAPRHAMLLPILFTVFQ